MHITQWAQPARNAYRLGDSNHSTFWRRRDYGGGENGLRETFVMDTGHHEAVQAHRPYGTEGTPMGPGPWALLTRLRRVIRCNRRPVRGWGGG